MNPSIHLAHAEVGDVPKVFKKRLAVMDRKSCLQQTTPVRGHDQNMEYNSSSSAIFKGLGQEAFNDNCRRKYVQSFPMPQAARRTLPAVPVSEGDA